MLPFLLGRCGYTWREVYLCPVIALQAAMRGKDEQDKLHWSIARWLAYQEMLLSPYIKSHLKPRSPVQFYRFPWEQQDQHESAKMTAAQEQELFRIIREFNDQKDV